MKFLQVILIFGICGCLRCDEIANMTVQDVEDLNGKYLVSINENKNDYAGQFIIGSLFYDTVKKYTSLRPTNPNTDRFFLRYWGGRCYRQPIGRHTIGGTPEKIASFLNLPNSHRYTGHCFRRTSATLLSDSGANVQMLKQLGRWRSDIIAQGYVENSMNNRQMIYNAVIQNATTDPESRPSTSAGVTIEHLDDNLNFNLNYADFDDDFSIDTIDPGSSK